jgi:hypothetical protein
VTDAAPVRRAVPAVYGGPGCDPPVAPKSVSLQYADNDYLIESLDRVWDRIDVSRVIVSRYPARRLVTAVDEHSDCVRAATTRTGWSNARGSTISTRSPLWLATGKNATSIYRRPWAARNGPSPGSVVVGRPVVRELDRA